MPNERKEYVSRVDKIPVRFYSNLNRVVSLNLGAAVECYGYELSNASIILCRAILEVCLEEKCGKAGINPNLDSDEIKSLLSPDDIKHCKIILAWGNAYAHGDEQQWLLASAQFKTTKYSKRPFN